MLKFSRSIRNKTLKRNMHRLRSIYSNWNHLLTNTGGTTRPVSKTKLDSFVISSIYLHSINVLKSFKSMLS